MYTPLIIKAAATLPFVFILQNGFTTQMDTLYRSENPVRNLSVFLVTWLLAMLSIFVLSVTRAALVRLFWAIALSIALFSYLTFIRIMGYAPTLGDAKTIFIEAGQAQAAFLTYWSELLIPFALSAVFFFAIYIPIPSFSVFKKRWGSLIAVILPLLPIAMISGMLIIKGGAAGVGMPGGPFITASYTVSIIYESLTQQSAKRDEVTLSPGPLLIENIILVVDESVSGDFISFNPEKTITPVLMGRADFIADFGIASSAHNCSSYSNATLRWGITPSNMAIARNLPTIWQYARNSGYTTSYIDSQKQSGTYGNFMDLNEAANIQNFIQFNSPQIERDIEYINNDNKAAQRAIDIIERGGSNFIYINKLGAHFPFEGKYPIDRAEFSPHQSLFQPINHSSREEVINSYKNAISWNVDRFFETILRSDIMQNTLLIYTSDHGQSIFDDSSNTTHCNRESSSPYQAWVPLFAATGNKVLLDRYRASVKTNLDSASHFNIFPTLLLMMGYPENEVESKYTHTLLSPIRRFGRFAVGSVFDGTDTSWMEFPKEMQSRL